MRFFTQGLAQVAHLLNPNVCLSCQEVIDPEQWLCPSCILQLRHSHSHVHYNQLRQRFGWQAPIQSIQYLVDFNKQGLVQAMLYAMKYEHRPGLCSYVGQLLGQQLAATPAQHWPSVLVPVPLHRSRLKHRGYNQAGLMAQGIAQMTGIPLDQQGLLRLNNTLSQTIHSRSERFINMMAAFSVAPQHNLAGMHIGLVDDVITTGATLQAICHKLADAGAERISIFAMAVTR